MKIVYFSPICWDDLMQRPQHIAEELSLKYQVTYIEPSISLMSFKKLKLNKLSNLNYWINSNLNIIRLKGIRFPKLINKYDFLKVNSIYEKYKLKNILSNADVIICSSPIFYDLFEKWINTKIILFDKIDDYVTLESNFLLKSTLKHYEDKLINKADCVIVTSKKMYIDISNAKCIKLIPNGLSIGMKSNSEIMFDQNSYISCSEESIVFGYIGTIDWWFDFKVIEIILERKKNAYIVLVGNNNTSQFVHERVQYIKSVDKLTLGKLVEQFDYCLYPFIFDSFIDSINPVKIYEYLYFNKNVIAVTSLEVDEFTEQLNIYHDYEELIDIVDSTVKAPQKPFDELALNKFIENNCWESRVIEIEKIINALGGKYGKE